MKVYKVLYTHQKTKKSKVWQDGTLREVNNTKLSLLSDSGRQIESVFTKSDKITVGDEIESDGHLILIDDEVKENTDANTTVQVQKTVIKQPIRPSFVSRRFTPPLLRAPVTQRTENTQNSYRMAESVANRDSLLGQLQSRKVVRSGQSLITSLSKTFPPQDSTFITSRSTATQDSTFITSRSTAAQDSTFTTSRSTAATSRDTFTTNCSSQARQSHDLQPSGFNLSSVLEMPHSKESSIKTPKPCNSQAAEKASPFNLFSQTQTPKEQRSIDCIFKVLNGGSNNSLQSQNVKVSHSEKVGDTPSSSSTFDFVDDSLFSPSPPNRTASPPNRTTESQERNSQSFSSSIDSRFIGDKIDEIAERPSEKNMINSSRQREDTADPDTQKPGSSTSLYETVDYFDIFGDDQINNREDFNPRVIELSTQKNVSNDNELEPETVDDSCFEENQCKSEDVVQHMSNNNSNADDLDVSIPSCSMWDVTGTEQPVGKDICGISDGNLRAEHQQSDEAAIIERAHKRRKLGDILRKPSSVPAQDEKPERRGFTVPFAAGSSAADTLNMHLHLKKHELKFAMEPLKRRHVIPMSFSSPTVYKNTLLDLVYEHLNVSLAKVCEKYTLLMRQTNGQANTQTVRCAHGPAKLCTVSKDGANKGRQFYTCKQKMCEMFKWSEWSSIPTNPQECFTFFSRQGVSLYKGCLIKRKSNSNLYMLHLATQDKHANYNKNDIWIIGPAGQQPSIMKSTFYGPSSGGYVELRLVNSNIPRCGAGPVDAIQALKAISELEIISALEKIHTLPLLPALVSRSRDEEDTPLSDIKLRGGAEEICVSVCREYQFNEKQEEAAAALINSLKQGPPVLCIHGVFGSGKSYMLAVLVLILTKVLEGPQHRILVTSTTNVAVDNILIKLLDLGFEHFIRVGSVKRIHRRITPYVVQHQECDNVGNGMKQEQIRSILGRHQVVGTTCAASPSVSNHDIVLFDEVSQVTEPSSLLPIIYSSCKRLVLVGDPQQLSPTVETQHAGGGGGLEQTLFDRMTKLHYPTVFLNTQYRCPPEISAISNTLFYSGELRDGNVPPSDTTQDLLLPIPPLTFISVPGSEAGFGESYSNAAEVKAISELLDLLFRKKVSKEDIAIITLYRGQESLLKKELPNSKSLKISTVDAVQGAEKSVVILSCVRSTRIGFADCPKRVNVAITRATQHLIILGNIQMLTTNQLWGTIIQICADRGVVMTLSDILKQLHCQ